MRLESSDYLSAEQLSAAIEPLEFDSASGNANKTIEDGVLRYLLADKTDELVNGLTSDREKAIALAEWVGTHFRNNSTFSTIHESHSSPSLLEKFVNRTGACGTRTSIYVFMAEIAGLNVKRIAIYNFGDVGAGHTAAQVYFDEDWHFFDVTYSGYFQKDGDILSFEEIIENGEFLDEYLVAFESFGDVYGRLLPSEQWREVDNLVRMNRIYNPSRLENAQSNGFIGDDTPVYLEYTIVEPIILGELDGDNKDVFASERSHSISEQLERFGFFSIPLFQTITIHDDNISSFSMVYYKIRLTKNTEAHLSISAAGCQIIGETTHTVLPEGGQWNAIIDQSTGDECILTLTHDIKQRSRGVWVDQIRFE